MSCSDAGNAPVCACAPALTTSNQANHGDRRRRVARAVSVMRFPLARNQRATIPHALRPVRDAGAARHTRHNDRMIDAPDSAPPARSLAIIGGGPAGLMAAEVARAAGVGVDLYDAKGSVGRKFLIAGKGGLNLTHSDPFDVFAGRYGERSPE